VRKSGGFMIPRRILRCYRSRYLLTPAMVENGRRLEAMHPEWEHWFWNHVEARRWVAETMPEWLECYDFYPLDRQRERLFRWLVLWQLGGVWLSAEMRPRERFEGMGDGGLVLAVEGRMTVEEFEERQRVRWEAGMPAGALDWIGDAAVAVVPGHWFTERVLALMVERAGMLDTGGEPDPEDEAWVTGGGVVNAAWLACLREGLPVGEAVLAEEGEGRFGRYAYRYGELNG